MGKNLDSSTLPFLGNVFEKFYLAGVNLSEFTQKGLMHHAHSPCP